MSIETPSNLDPTRRAGRVTLNGATGDVLPGARRALIDLSRTILAAEAVGVARESTDLAAEYSKQRLQFGRPIAMFQAVKHHCANMAVATELATAAVWDAARAAAAGGDEFSYAAAAAAALAVPAADLCANLGMQVHGGIGFTWEHDCHIYLRRATAIGAVLDADDAAVATTDLTRQGVRRERTVDLPPEAEPVRDDVRAFVTELEGLEGDAKRDRLIDSGYAMPHWPAPYGRDAKAIEQLVIEQEFAAAGVKRPQLGITGWVVLTMIQHGTAEQVSRWVRPALDGRRHLVPAVQRARRRLRRRRHHDQGHPRRRRVAGQRAEGLDERRPRRLVRPGDDPHQPRRAEAPGHHHDGHRHARAGVEVRPLKMATGGSEFNEVFFNDVFVPDDDVIGPVDNGWTVARATLGNESVSIGGGSGGGAALPDDALIGCSMRIPSASAAVPPRRHPPRDQPRHGDAQHAHGHPGRPGQRPGTRGQHHEARAVRAGPRGDGDHVGIGRLRHGVPGGAGAIAGRSRAVAPGHVDRRRYVGDQAQPDR